MDLFSTCQLLAWLAWLCLVQAKAVSENAITVPELRPEDVKGFVQGHKKTAISFCALYSRKCRQIKEDRDLEYAQELLQDKDIRIASFDCQVLENVEFCNEQNFRSYPAIRIYEGDVDAYVQTTGRKSGKQLAHKLLTGEDLPPEKKLKPAPSPYKPIKPEIPNPYPNSTANNVVYRGENGTNAVVKLELPGLPINLPTVSEDLKHSSAVIFEFNFTDDGKHVMLNGEVLALQVPNPSIPALLTAKQVPLDYHIGDIHGVPQHKFWAHGEFRSLGIDYEIFSRNRDDPNIRYSNYYPELVINFIGCSSPDPEAYPSDFLLDSLDQQVIKITFEDVEGNRQSDDPKRVYRIQEITLRDRSNESGYLPRPTRPEFKGYRVPKPDDRPCSRWSWRCADIGDPPWYRFIWRQHFDEFGRIGSMRWRASRWWLLVIKPGTQKLTPPVWIWMPATLLLLYFRLVRPIMQKKADFVDLEKGGTKD